MKNFVLLFFMLNVVISVSGQTIQPIIPSVPTSPQSEAFKMYGKYAVNYSTGTPDISIPLYEINHRGYKLPINLKFVPTPIRPGYNYDVFGLGWALSINGSVSRTIEYLPDEERNFKIETPGDAQMPNSFHLCDNCISGYNYGHDQFNVVLPNGTSFDFIIENQNNNIVFMVSDGRQVKISCNVVNSQIESFQIIDEDGVKYTFNGGDYPRSDWTYVQYANVFVSWHLTRIDLPNSNEPILFAYNIDMTPAGYSLVESGLTISARNKYKDVGQANEPDYQWIYETNSQRFSEITPNAYKMRLLTSINYGQSGKNEIKFFYNYSNAGATYQANKIQVLENQLLIKEIGFGTSIRSGGVYDPGFNFPLATLNFVSIKGSDVNVAPIKYEFTNPSIGTFNGVDHWGYLTNSSGMDMPNFNIYVGWDLGPYPNGLTAKNKESNDPCPFDKYIISQSSHSSSDCRRAGYAFAISRIKYPSGGYTDFEWEDHEFLSSTSNSGDYDSEHQNPSVKSAPGARIKAITNYSGIGMLSNKMNYRYGKTRGEVYGSNESQPFIHTGLGEAVVDPNVLTYLSYSDWEISFLQTGYPYPAKNMIVGVNHLGQREIFANPYDYLKGYGQSEWGSVVTLSARNFRKLLNGRRPIVYSEVSVYEGEIDENSGLFPMGKTVYKYDLSGSGPEEFIEPIVYWGNTTGYVPRPFYYDRLIEKTDYKFDSQLHEFKPIKKEANSYAPMAINSYLDWEFGNKYLPEVYNLFSNPNGWDFYQETPTFFSVSGAFSARFSYQGVSNLIEKTTTVYDEQGNQINTNESYSYNIRNQVSGISIIGSKGEVVDKLFSYPTSGTGAPAVVESMVSKNIISPVLESTIKVSNKTIASNKTEYATFGTNQNILPSKSYELEITSSGSQYVVRDEIKSYSTNGNPLELLSKENIYSSYIWGYDDRYMIAHAINARSNEILHDNFEDLSGWDGSLSAYDNTKSRTGKYSGRIDKLDAGERVSHCTKWLTISLTGTKKFRYSTWVYSNGPSAEIFLFMKRANEPNYFSYVTSVATHELNKWVLIEGEYNVPSDVTQLGIRLDNNGGGTVWFDDVRLYPAEGQMTTYTYKPLVGMTSQTDINNRTVTYEYDSFNRLTIVRDNEGKIIKKTCYNYAGQAEECNTFYNEVRTGNFTKNNCSGGQGSTVTYTVPANLYSASTLQAANDLAQADVNANGQAYANQYGTCLYSSANYSGTYYSAVCTNGATPQPIYINVPSGMFTSTISQTDANSQAYAYAQNYANTYGTCSSGVEVNAWNDVGADVYVELQNTSTNQYYYFQASPFHYGAIGTIPAGNYNVTVTVGSYGFYSFSVGCYNYSSGYSATFYNLTINSSCNSISIY